MTTDWYCKIAGAELGPLSSQQLRALAADGRLRPEDEVCQGQGGKWVAADRVKGLLKSASSEVLVAQPLAEDMPVAAKAPPPHAKKVDATALPQAKTAPQPPESPQAAVPVAKAAAVSAPGPKAAAAPTAFNFGGSSTHSGAASKGRSMPLSPADAAKQRQQKRKKLLVASIGGLVALTVIGLVFVFANPFGSDAKDSGPSAEMLAAQQFKEGELTSTSIEDIDLGLSKDGTPNRSEEATGDRWLDATKEQASTGPVNVRIVSVRIDKPRIIRGTGRAATPKEDCLIVTLELVNSDPEKKIVHAGWGRPPAIQRVAINDNHGNPYKVETYSGTIDGQQSNTSLYADDPIQDVLVFERPVPAAEYLRLELPASAVGENGVLRFQIPKSMIGAEPIERPVAAGSKAGEREATDDQGEVYQLQAVERAIGMDTAKPEPSVEGYDALKRDNPDLFPDQM
ncbi:MAG: DUF4339 domain-containing protein [Patescibacteria group bacterium]|nr:DUF4339 domain-containing protein [Patescibacteria group bacterium]